MTPEEIAAAAAQAAQAEPAPATGPKPAVEPAAPPVTDGEPGAPKGPISVTPEPTEEPQGAEPSAAEKRIRRLVAEREEARRQEAYWRGQAEARGTQAAPAATPKPEIPLTAEAYEAAGKSYDELLIDKAAARMRQEQEVASRANEAVRAKEALEKSGRAFMERVQREAEVFPEIMDIVNNYHIPASPYFVPISPAMADAIRDSEVAPKLIRELAANKNEALRIAQLSPLAAARELGRMEARILSAPKPAPPRTISQAPEPVKPLTPEGATEVDLEKVPIEDFIAKRNAQQFGSRR